MTNKSVSPRSKKARPSWLPVVAAIIKREKKVLLGMRPESGSLAGMWEFPGGKIEMGEQPEIALARELKEELKIEAEIGPLLIATTHNYTGVGIIILFYEVKYWKGQPQASHHSALNWFDLSELSKLQLPEANRNVLDKIIELLK